jgi:hypothetical protein
MSDESAEKERQRLIEQLKERDAPHPKVLKGALANELVRRYRLAKEAGE